MIDSHGRTINYLRISLTDRCNFRCIYCMPDEGVAPKSHEEIMSFDEIIAIVQEAATMGITRLRLTGGEPLVRLGVADLIKELNAIEGIDSIAMTTNGVLLPKMASELREAGLSRVNISLDTLDPEQFKQITRRGTIDQTLAGIDAALEYGFSPVKINAVTVRSLNQNFLEFAKLSLDRPLHVRFIEYMPVGESSGSHGCGWGEEDVIPSDELRELISVQAQEAGLGQLIPAEKHKPQGWGPASYYKFEGAEGTVGFISPMSRHFCKECNRLRLSADGKLRLCLFSDEEYDIRKAYADEGREGVRAMLRQAMNDKPDEHHHKVGTKRLMSQIGG